jgi:hypothetical protein
MDVYPTDLPDHNQQLGASRACCVCAGIFTREQLRVGLGWEPTEHGWRCGACSRRRWGLAAWAADLLIAGTAGAPMAPDVGAAEHEGVLRAIGAQELQRPGTAWESGFSVPVDVRERVPSHASPTFCE